MELIGKLCNIHKVKKVLFFSFCFFLFLSWSVAAYSQEQTLRIHFIDVGDGDATLIQTPNGKTVLIDTGNLITGHGVVEYLKKNRVSSLDYLILTHPHFNHIGGIFFISQMMEIEGVYDNGQLLPETGESSDIYRWYEELVRQNRHYRVLRDQNEILIDGVKLRILWPPDPFVFSDFNSNSLVIMVKYKNFRCLLSGDLTAQGEAELIKKGSNLKANILKVGHHGAGDASTSRFLEAVEPKISIISVNKDNIRGYPSKQVLEELKEVGCQVYRTDEHGNVTILIENNGNYSIVTEN